jgi:uncharacterized protein (TIGR00251 family)
VAESVGVARITVRLTPRAGRNAIDGWDADVLRARVAAPPVDGKANDALLRLLAKALGTPQSDVALVSGAQSRTKTIDVDGMTLQEIRGLLTTGD